MESFLKMDIFFFITTIAVVILVIISIFVGYYLIKILRNVKESTDALKDEVRAAGARIGEIEKEITESAIFKFIFRKKKSRNKQTS